jgi:UDP-N-acetylmuramate: L-alanyl-gamma-D-glutamyl-meso-diaminopimelate ligase
MHIHILGICGTFMGGIALLARAAGHTVTGSDVNVYPPMSKQLEEAGIQLMEGYQPEHLQPPPDMVVVGNAMSRGNPAVEYMLDNNFPYTSGPQWLAEHILRDRWVLAVAGTHGKTTTASMAAWILDYAGLKPGYLIGGIPRNFGESARFGETPFFVVEADEYDTAFFDKRSKFIHYRPRTLVLNNLEFDHADIFDDMGMIQRQFHHLIRIVPGNGLLISPVDDKPLNEVLEMGSWTPIETFGNDGQWQAELLKSDGSLFSVSLNGDEIGQVQWKLTGDHNVSNALASVAAARHAGVPAKICIDALCKFENVKRRMELRGEVNGIRVYDDFAHHPTAIASTLKGLRRQVGDRKIIAVLEPRSNTMRMDIHKDALPVSLKDADRVMIFSPSALDWDAHAVFKPIQDKTEVFISTKDIINTIKKETGTGDQILVMSNGGFEGIHQRILEALHT